MCNIDYKKSIIESTLTSAKLFHDDRLNTIDSTANDSITTNTPPPPHPAQATIITTTPIPTQVSSSSLSNLKKRFSSSSSSSRKKKSDRQSATEILKIKEDTDATNINNESSSSLSQHNYVNQDLTTAESDYEQEDLDDEFNIISNKNLTQHEIGRTLYTFFK